ncbi:bis(5'-adenosyl)-triphosphatase enpp4 [Plectropomus leopardus]|uniref:bis(5'-adenosyl)-triphosphatase enpp4 n=1 Tax=Plectropomus leopardus TaxID=160734 RepID=UPI001C4DB719|nr:bis(5'-adenosyl)-triphosphatase enpp4 [Plectropomus leopardus]XP_042368796.1 bis(5'-adenosyl)-triphosphatase enpp4 [Plectropomus leopardus]
MLLKILLGFLCGVRVYAQQDPPPLLLVSFDGFRADYVQRFPMPNLKLLYSQGVLVEQLTNVFPTKTFPNHYSLVTGLYAESHGILANNMYDPVSNKSFHVGNNNTDDPAWWNEAQPLWVTALDSGYKTAAMMWPGSDVTISNRTPSHFLPFNRNVTFQQRLGNVTKWILGDGKEPGVKFAAMYWDEPDRSGHLFGPDNDTAMSQVLKEVDDHIGLLISELKRNDLWGHVNVLVTSDHGMAQCSAERLIRLNDCLHPDNYTLVDRTPVATLIPHNSIEVIFALLKNCHPNMTVYLKSDIPDRLHYQKNERVQPITLIADEGWTIVQGEKKLPRLGDHGYDNSLPSMHPFMAALGPSFRKGYRMSSLQSVDIYPLMCHLLSVPPQPNNGTLTQARHLLAAEAGWNVPLVISLVVGVLLVLTTITVMFRFLNCRRHSGPRPFQRLQLDDHDDDDPLLE